MPAQAFWTSAGFIVLLGAAIGCSPCEDPYPPGTRFKVTVPAAFDDCHVTFAAGHTYDLVAGPHRETGAELCEESRAEAPPLFTTTEYEFGRCGYDAADMGLECAASVAGCPGDIRIFYGPLPDERGDVVDATLRLSYVSSDVCENSCGAAIPVKIRW